MDLDIEWRCPNRNGVDISRILSSAVQSGIKLFLHQRNTISLPLEQLEVAIKQGKEEVQTLANKIATFDEDDHDKNDDDDGPRGRIKAFASQNQQRRRLIHQKTKKEKYLKKGTAEIECITNALKMVDDIITLQNFGNILGVGLVFGTFIFSPKEMIYFDLSQNDHSKSVKNCEDENGGRKNNAKIYSDLMRNFYKKIILSKEFQDFTRKRLIKTKSHLFILSKSTMEFKAEDKVTFLENSEMFKECLITSPKDVSISEQDSLDLTNIARKQGKRKILKIRIVADTNKKVDKTDNSSIICDISNESLFCYQIPMRV